MQEVPITEEWLDSIGATPFDEGEGWPESRLLDIGRKQFHFYYSLTFKRWELSSAPHCTSIGAFLEYADSLGVGLQGAH
jgi:hypothetical protein